MFSVLRKGSKRGLRALFHVGSTYNGKRVSEIWHNEKIVQENRALSYIQR